MARRIRGSHLFPYKFPFAFAASLTTRTVNTATGRTIKEVT